MGDSPYSLFLCSSLGFRRAEVAREITNVYAYWMLNVGVEVGRIKGITLTLRIPGVGVGAFHEFPPGGLELFVTGVGVAPFHEFPPGGFELFGGFT
jgi:hypothetical protein